MHDENLREKKKSNEKITKIYLLFKKELIIYQKIIYYLYFTYTNYNLHTYIQQMLILKCYVQLTEQYAIPKIWKNYF